MSEDRQSAGDEADVEEIESLLRELTAEDAVRDELPTDLWGRIEGELSGDDAEIVDLAMHRGSERRRVVLGAIAAAAIVLVGSLALLNRGDDNGPAVVANAELAYDPLTFDDLGAEARALASLIDDDGTLRVEIDTSDLPSPIGEAADLELWLIEPDSDGNPAQLVSLGLIEPGSPGQFALPATFDRSVFSIVDISVEPRDGNPGHSGRSILRGAFAGA